jgi:hypothetical protein
MLLPFILLPRLTGEGREGEGLSRVGGKLQIMICNRRDCPRRLPPPGLPRMTCLYRGHRQQMCGDIAYTILVFFKKHF